MNFTIHITGSDFKGEANRFDWASNFIRKYENANRELRQNNVKRISKIVANSIKSTARRNKWKTIPSSVIINNISIGEAHVTVTDEKMQLAKFLHFGTKRHYVSPKRAKALHWVIGGKSFFSKGHWVNGIIAYKFFALTPKARFDIQQYISNLKFLFSTKK